MPRTKKIPVSPAQNGPLDTRAEVLTLAEAAAYLRVTSDDVLSLVRERILPGRQIGQHWRFLKIALQDWLQSGPTKTGLLKYAGAIADDPHVEEMLEEVYRQRGRPATEEG